MEQEKTISNIEVFKNKYCYTLTKMLVLGLSKVGKI